MFESKNTRGGMESSQTIYGVVLWFGVVIYITVDFSYFVSQHLLLNYFFLIQSKLVAQFRY